MPGPLEELKAKVDEALAKNFRVTHRCRKDGTHTMRARAVGDAAQLPSRVVNLRQLGFAAVIPGDTVVEAVTTQGINSFLQLYNGALIMRLVLTWFPNPPAALISPLATVCDPYLNLFRGLIPPLGGSIDLSPILAFIVLDVFTSSAAALPAEMPKGGAEAQEAKPRRGPLRRLFGRRAAEEQQ
ncbi:unnamed protein product [Pedinophyceae sp. YPF-701]|nr:unnamed protein product [Pedinophyceae sp. YPF-701]